MVSCFPVIWILASAPRFSLTTCSNMCENGPWPRSWQRPAIFTERTAKRVNDFEDTIDRQNEEINIGVSRLSSVAFYRHAVYTIKHLDRREMRNLNHRVVLFVLLACKYM